MVKGCVASLAFQLLLIIQLFSLSIETVEAQKETFGPAIKVMSFNIRFGTADDGENHWDKRKELVVETINVFDPDLLGVQEALKFQAEFLNEQLEHYQFVGRSREVNPDQGEFCGIFLRKERFEVADQGHLWLSETPDVAGSKSWDSSLPRMVSWVLVKDKLQSNREFIFANTHFDHRGAEARIESAKVIRKQLVDASPGIPIVIVGDFNTAETTEPYQTLIGKEISKQELENDKSGKVTRILVDGYRVIHPEKNGHESSFSAWNGNRQGSRIDWIIQSKEFETVNAAINYHSFRGRYPSDHYPVQCVLKLGPTEE